jgi:FkbM family methyltransferase
MMIQWKRFKKHIYTYSYLYLFILLLLLLILFYQYGPMSSFSENMSDQEKNLEDYIQDEDFMHTLQSYTFYDEADQIIDPLKDELHEQYQAYKYIQPEDVVLELGGRYGTVSVMINKIVKNKDQHVVVEPDRSIIPALEKNREKNQCNFQILPKFVSNQKMKIVNDGYGTHTLPASPEEEVDDQEIRVSYDEFKSLYPQKFDVMVVDCEGCLGNFLEMMGDDLQHIKKIFFEADQAEHCDYTAIKEKLLQNGFQESVNNKDFHFIYLRK